MNPLSEVNISFFFYFETEEKKNIESGINIDTFDGTGISLRFKYSIMNIQVLRIMLIVFLSHLN